MFFPRYRARRIRQNKFLRKMVKENVVNINDLVMPLFVLNGKNEKKPIPSMPGQFQLSIDNLIPVIRDINELKIPAIILFGIPENKDLSGQLAYDKDGIIQKTIKVLKNIKPELCIITDVCLCQYLEHGHCGIIKNKKIDNDYSAEVIAKIALSHAQAGADMVAPSDMMDGRILKIRQTLDNNSFSHIPIMSYSVKYSSAYYGPFRNAANSSPKFGDRSSYQMDPANSEEAIRESLMDINEGADILMIKPALPYLDIIYKIKYELNFPIAAYNVSGEYSMIKAADKLGWVNGNKIMFETMTSIKRAGADIILTYFAIDFAKLIRK